jgi:CDP-diglyceride synthetase
MKALLTTNCRVCAIVRIHVAGVVGILAAWRLRPEWFELAKDVSVQHLAAVGVVLAVVAIFGVKVFEHYRQSKRKDSDRDRLDGSLK